MKRFFAVGAVVAAAVLGLSGSAFGDITVGDHYVTVSMTIDVVSLTCDGYGASEYDYAWTQSTVCDRPGGINEEVFGLTYTHLKIITADNQCLLFNGRIDPAIVGERDLVMNIPIGVPLTSSNITFGPGSDFNDVEIYWQAAGFYLERGSSFRIEITEQTRTCETRQTAEAILEWAVVDIPPACCVGMTGDIDSSGRIDIADVLYLINWMFRGGPPPPCMDEADVDGSGQVDIADANYFVDWLFRGGPPPVDCP